MASVIQWIVANWQPVVLAVLAIDSALIPILPKVPILVTIKNLLSGLLGPSQPPAP